MMLTMNTLGQRLKQCRKEKKVTQEAAAKAIGMSQTNLSELENDRYPTSSFIPMMAMYYGVDAMWLATGKDSGERIAQLQQSGNVSAGPQLGRVPLISMVAAGNWSENVDNFVAGFSDNWVATSVQVKQHTYALAVEGDSMEPKFPNGAIIIVEPNEEARNGSYVIVRQNGSDTTFKQLVIDAGQHYLKPLNSRYPIITMREDAVICGVVKQAIIEV